MGIQNLLGDTQALGGKSDGCNAPPFSVSTVVHLYGRFVDVAPTYGNRGNESGNPAASLVCSFIHRDISRV